MQVSIKIRDLKVLDNGLSIDIQFIPNDDIKITPSVDYKLWWKSLNKEPTSQNSVKNPKMLSQRITKRCFRALGLM